MHFVPLYTNPQDFIARLWMITQQQKNLQRGNGYHWTSVKTCQPVKNYLTFVANLQTPVGGGRQTTT
jgi:hypothetical protein